MASGKAEKEIEHSRWGQESGTRSRVDKETNEKFGGGKSWKEVVAEQKAEQEKGKKK